MEIYAIGAKGWLENWFACHTMGKPYTNSQTNLPFLINRRLNVPHTLAAGASGGGGSGGVLVHNAMANKLLPERKPTETLPEYEWYC